MTTVREEAPKLGIGGKRGRTSPSAVLSYDSVSLVTQPEATKQGGLGDLGCWHQPLGRAQNRAEKDKD